MEEKMDSFLREGTELLSVIKHSHELAIAKEESANQRIKLIQWMIVVILAPLLLTSSSNAVKNAKQMDEDEIYDIFTTKERSVHLNNNVYFMNEKKFDAVSRGDLIDTDEEYNRYLKQFVGDKSRGGN